MQSEPQVKARAASAHRSQSGSTRLEGNSCCTQGEPHVVGAQLRHSVMTWRTLLCVLGSLVSPPQRSLNQLALAIAQHSFLFAELLFLKANLEIFKKCQRSLLGAIFFPSLFVPSSRSNFLCGLHYKNEFWCLFIISLRSCWISI